MIRYDRGVLLLCMTIVLLVSCTNGGDHPQTLFSKLTPEKSGIDFANTLIFDQKFNIYKYRNYYNGGGVGIGDVNNDGYVDVYFTANMSSNRLYLNNGDLTFTDVTETAGVGGTKSWSTGVSMADVNGDGNLDIYVCNSGNIEGDNKQNELFINNGDGTFTEKAEEYGLADPGFSTHAAFFDYDKDGDIDVYLLNNSFQAIGSFNLKKNQRPIRNKEGGDKLFRNDGNRFTDVSEEAGIYGSVIGFGLGVTVGDIDLDGWQDIFVSNDFFERDYIYMNNGDGTFTENLESQMKSITGASMGADMADINNDGYPEIFVTEMLPEPNGRVKTKTTFENWDRYQYNIENGYYHQFTRNMMHLNNGDGSFSEIGRLLGVEATDWSWGALIQDFDNDGFKDLFIANGIYKDLTDQDYINYISTEEVAKSVISSDGVDFEKLTDVIPSNRIPNYMYKNTGNLTFEKVSEIWGLDEPSHSNGSAYADLDNDGDLDLVVSNLNEVASIYINESNEYFPERHFLKFNLEGRDKNTQAVGAKVIVYDEGEAHYYEQVPVKGFQSSVDPRINVGVPTDIVDSVVVYWPLGRKTVLQQVKADQIIDLSERDAESGRYAAHMGGQDMFSQPQEIRSDLYVHEENEFVDFDRDRLLHHMLSTEGPALCKGDFNADGREDMYVGGAKDQPGKVLLQSIVGSWRNQPSQDFLKDKLAEDVDCACFDADGDGDMDIYVASGGNEFPNSSSGLIDRLYINDGNGRFSKSNQILPSFQFENSSVVAPADVDQDGDIDLFVGVRARPFLIGVPASSYLLLNDGAGKFKNVTKQQATELENIGMVTDATWSDIDGDSDQDLIVVGEWMPITIFENKDGRLENVTVAHALDSTNGWWNSIASADVDGDGDDDFIIGNHGYNSRFRASQEKPVSMYVNDFDQNGTAEPVICTYMGDKDYPIALKHDLVMQMPSLKKKYFSYENYKDQQIEDIFTPEEMNNAIKLEVYQMATVILLNHGDRDMEMRELPREAQLSPTYAIAIDDYDNDDQIDILLGGNFYAAKPEVGRYDASYGTLLKGDGKGGFTVVPNRLSGLYLDGQIRDMTIILQENEKKLIAARNDTTLVSITYR